MRLQHTRKLEAEVEELEVEVQVMIMIKRKDGKRNTKNMTESDPMRGENKGKRKRKRGIKKIKILNYKIDHLI